MTNKLHDALAFAVSAHRGQDRKYTGLPYVTHPIAVMEIVQTIEHTEEMLIAALLHDVVEDTEIGLSAIQNKFGIEVALLVEQLTDISKPSDGNRVIRKAIDRKRLLESSNEVKTIKLADLIHNSSSIVRYDPEFAKVYMKEKELLLHVLKGGSDELMEQAESIISNYYHSL